MSSVSGALSLQAVSDSLLTDRCSVRLRTATENRTLWSKLRNSLTSDEHNAACLAVVDNALFVVCLDDDERIVRGLSLSTPAQSRRLLTAPFRPTGRARHRRRL